MISRYAILAKGGSCHVNNEYRHTDRPCYPDLSENGWHIYLIGSFATGTARKTSDIDFAVKGCKDILKLEEDLEEIETLRKIDIFDYDSIKNKYLLENIDKYGKQIY